MRTVWALPLLSLSLWLGGCASVVHPEPNTSRMDITLSCGELRNVPGQCRVRMGPHEARMQAPGAVQVLGQMKSLELVCESDFFRSHSMTVYPQPRPAMAGNLVLGGLIGLTVDSTTGRGWTFPQHVEMRLPECFR